MRLSFIEDFDIYNNNPAAVFFDYLVDALYLCDYLSSFAQPRRIQPSSSDPPFQLKFRKTLQSFQAIDRGTIIVKGSSRWEWSGKVWSFCLEVLSLVPLELFGYLGGMSNFQLLRINRFIRLRHYFSYWERFCEVLSSLNLANSRPVQRFWMLTTIMAVTCHVGGLATIESDGSLHLLRTMQFRYLRAMYWSVQTLDTVGFGDIVAHSMPETYFCIFFFYISGFLIYYSIANLMTIVMDADSVRTTTLINKAKFAKYSVYRDLPEDLCTRVENFYDYQYETLKGVDEKEILSQLPPNIAQQIQQFVVRDILSGIELFSDLNKGMLNALSDNIETYFYSPDDVIIGSDTTVSGAYVISRGEIGLITPTGEVMQLLRSRQHFGLLALKESYVTANSYHSRSFSEVFFLRGSVYRHICHLYLQPEEITEMIDRRLSKPAEGAAAAGTIPAAPAIAATTAATTPTAATGAPPALLTRTSMAATTRRTHRSSLAVRWSATNLLESTNQPSSSSNGSSLSSLMAADSEKASLTLHELLRQSLKPLSLPRRIWDCIIFSGLIFYSLSIGWLMAATFRPQFYHDMWGLLVTSYVTDILFALDTLAHGRFFYFIRNGVVITQGKEITQHFWTENHWLLVLLSIAPVDLIVTASLGSPRLLPTFRLLKLIHLRHFFPYYEHALDFFSDKARVAISFEMSRFVTLYFFLYLSCHWAGCFWILAADIAVQVFHFPINWILKDKLPGVVNINRNSMYAVTYARAIYWAASVMSSIGFPDILETNSVETVTIILVMFIGYLLFNTLLGALANLIASFNRDKREFNAKVERMRGLMQHTHVPAHIQERVFRYYEYVWSRFSGVNEKEILDSLPRSLRTDLVKHILRPLVTTIPFFNDLSEPMEHLLIGLFEPRIALDGDALMVYGEIGKEMFVIERGTLHVTNESRSMVYATLGAGDYIGESCLLEMTPRTASVYAVGYVDTYYLTNDNFLQAAEKFPSEYLQIIDAIKAVIAEKQRKNEAARLAKEQAIKAAAAALPQLFHRLWHSTGLQTLFGVGGDSHVLLSSSPEGTASSSSFIHPDSRQRMVNDLVVCVTLLYYTIMIPFRLALTIPTGVYAIDYVFDMVNILDGYFHARRYALYRGGHMITEAPALWQLYLRERIWIDGLAMVPYDLLVLIVVAQGASASYVYLVWAVLRIPKLIKVAMLPSYYGQVERLMTTWKIHFVWFKFVELTMLILIIAHWVACGWYLLATKENERRCRGQPERSASGLPCLFVGTWVEQQYDSLKLPVDGGDQWTRFIRAINFAIPTLTSETMGDMVGRNEKESFYAFLIMFCGLSINGAVIGSIVNLVSDANVQTTTIYRSMEQLREYLLSHRVPDALIASSTAYMTYLLSDEGHYNLIRDDVFAQLPHALATDIDFELKTLPFLRRCPFFDGYADDTLREISSKLRMMSFAKGDQIITYGDLGHEMYFIHTGSVHVVSADGQTVYSTLEEGAFFGETAMFFKSARMANIVVHSPFCACFQLRKEDLDQVMMSTEYDGEAVVRSFTRLQEFNQRRNRNVQMNLQHAQDTTHKLHKLIHTTRRVRRKWIVYLRKLCSPESLFRVYWDTLGLILLVYYIFSIPLFIGFFSQSKLAALSQYVGFEILFNLYWLADIGCKWYLFSYRTDLMSHKLVVDGDSIRQRYLATTFWYDVVASIPSEFLILNPRIDYLAVLILRSCHLVRCPQLNHYATMVEAHLRRRVGVVIGRSFGMMLKAGVVYVILNHWLACVYFMIHRYAERTAPYTYAVADGLAVYDPVTGRHDICTTTVLMCYGRSVYFVLGTMTSIGYGDISPYTSREILWEQVVAIAGAYIAAIFMGYIGAYQLDKDARSDHAFQAKIRTVKAYITYRQLPPALKESILMQFNYAWTKNRSLNGIHHTLLSHLSEPCRIDLSLQLQSEVLQEVPLLHDACLQLKRRLAAKLTPQIVVAESVVYRAGDVGHQLFFVHGGELQVMLSQDKSTLDAFGLGALRILLNKEERYGSLYVRGSHFGEFCLLSKSGLRAETVHAKMTSEVYSLLKQDLWELFLYMTPEVRRDFIYQLFTRVGD
eukprot:gene8702-6258_t